MFIGFRITIITSSSASSGQAAVTGGGLLQQPFDSSFDSSFAI